MHMSNTHTYTYTHMHTRIRTHIYAHRSNGKKDKDSDSSDEEDSEKKKLKGQLEGISRSPCVPVSISVVAWGGTSNLCVCLHHAKGMASF